MAPGVEARTEQPGEQAQGVDRGMEARGPDARTAIAKGLDGTQALSRAEATLPPGVEQMSRTDIADTARDQSKFMQFMQDLGTNYPSARTEIAQFNSVYQGWPDAAQNAKYLYNNFRFTQGSPEHMRLQFVQHAAQVHLNRSPVRDHENNAANKAQQAADAKPSMLGDIWSRMNGTHKDRVKEQVKTGFDAADAKRDAEAIRNQTYDKLATYIQNPQGQARLVHDKDLLRNFTMSLSDAVSNQNIKGTLKALAETMRQADPSFPQFNEKAPAMLARAAGLYGEPGGNARGMDSAYVRGALVNLIAGNYALPRPGATKQAPTDNQTPMA